jgi:MoxR-like ATPase
VQEEGGDDSKTHHVIADYRVADDGPVSHRNPRHQDAVEYLDALADRTLPAEDRAGDDCILSDARARAKHTVATDLARLCKGDLALLVDRLVRVDKGRVREEVHLLSWFKI